MSRLMIIPAAGLGTRLGSAVPKLLHPVNRRPMIDHLLDLYAGAVDRFVIVIHPAVEAAVRRHCEPIDLTIDFEQQPSPTGMLDAILLADARVREYEPAHVWITWCDQVAVHPRTVEGLAERSRPGTAAALVFPTVRRTAPYVHLVRDAGGRIVEIRHRREGDPMPDAGETDMGLFSLSFDAYTRLLPEFAQRDQAGATTRERNFLPFIPWVSARATVETFPAQDEIESVGVNTPDELRLVEDYLLARDGSRRP